MSRNVTDIVQTGTGSTSSTSFSTDGILTHRNTNLIVQSVDPVLVGDDGGWKIEIDGIFPASHKYYVSVFKNSDTDFVPQLCYSGVFGDGALCRPSKGNTRLSCWVPPMPIFDGYDLRVHSQDGTYTRTILGQLDVVHRSFTSNLYSLRSDWPPPRDVGPMEIDEED